MLAPLAPHIAEELWARLGHDAVPGLGAVPRGRPGPAGGRRGRAAGAGQRQGAGQGHRARRRRRRRRRAGRPRPTRVASALEGAEIRRVVVVPGRMVNFVVA